MGPAGIFQKLTFQKLFPEYYQSVGPDLGPNCFDKVISPSLPARKMWTWTKTKLFYSQNILLIIEGCFSHDGFCQRMRKWHF